MKPVAANLIAPLGSFGSVTAHPNMNSAQTPRSRVLITAVYLLTACVTPHVAERSLSIGAMTINGRTNALGIGADDISFAWEIEAEARDVVQSAYRIRVGTSAGGDQVWDSGRVKSDRQIDVTLPNHLQLAPATRYFWQVRIWDRDGTASKWSLPAWFETGLLSPADWSGAKWIAHPARAAADSTTRKATRDPCSAAWLN